MEAFNVGAGWPVIGDDEDGLGSASLSLYLEIYALISEIESHGEAFVNISRVTGLPLLIVEHSSPVSTPRRRVVRIRCKCREMTAFCQP